LIGRLILGSALAAAVLATLAGPAVVRAGASSCAFEGPKWSQGGTTGTTYDLDVQGVPCGYAIPYARKLAGTANKKPFYPVRGGPAGWVCNAQASSPKITSGACVKGTKRFGWHAASF
jgi:hypothetical protein